MNVKEHVTQALDSWIHRIRGGLNSGGSYNSIAINLQLSTHFLGSERFLVCDDVQR